MSENNMINEEEISVLKTWQEKMKEWYLPEDLFAEAAPVAMRPVRLLLSDEDGGGDDALMMYEMYLADRRYLCLFLDTKKWSRYCNQDKRETIGMAYPGSESYFIDDDAASVEKTFSKLIPCFKEATIRRSDWDGPHFMVEFWTRSCFEADMERFRYYLKEDSLEYVPDYPFLVELLGKIFYAWEDGLAEGVVEKECYTEYWKPQMAKLKKVYAEGKRTTITLGEWAEIFADLFVAIVRGHGD